MAGVELKIEQSDLNEFYKKLDEFKVNTGKSALDAIVDACFKLKATAQQRLKGRGHIVTSRLINSIYVSAKAKVDNPDYSSDEGNFNAEFKTVQPKDNEVLVGTNVEYASSIEFGHKAIEINSPVNIKNVGWRYIKTLAAKAGDSFLYWAFKNIDFTKSIADLIRENINNPNKMRGVQTGKRGGQYTIGTTGKKNYIKK